MKEVDNFDAFWLAYPRRKEKLRAHTAYDKARKNGSHEEIMSGVQKYATEVAGKDPRFTKHPATWLNAGCWMDYEACGPPIVLTGPRVFKCQECLQISIGADCGYCRRMMA